MHTLEYACTFFLASDCFLSFQDPHVEDGAHPGDENTVEGSKML